MSLPQLLQQLIEIQKDGAPKQGRHVDLVTRCLTAPHLCQTLIYCIQNFIQGVHGLSEKFYGCFSPSFQLTWTRKLRSLSAKSGFRVAPPPASVPETPVNAVPGPQCLLVENAEDHLNQQGSTTEAPAYLTSSLSSPGTQDGRKGHRSHPDLES